MSQEKNENKYQSKSFKTICEYECNLNEFNFKTAFYKKILGSIPHKQKNNSSTSKLPKLPIDDDKLSYILKKNKIDILLNNEISSFDKILTVYEKICKNKEIEIYKIAENIINLKEESDDDWSDDDDDDTTSYNKSKESVQKLISKKYRELILDKILKYIINRIKNLIERNINENTNINLDIMKYKQNMKTDNNNQNYENFSPNKDIKIVEYHEEMYVSNSFCNKNFNETSIDSLIKRLNYTNPEPSTLVVMIILLERLHFNYKFVITKQNAIQ